MKKRIIFFDLKFGIFFIFLIKYMINFVNLLVNKILILGEDGDCMRLF